MAFNIGPTLSVGGEKEYTRAMASIRESMKYVKAEAAKVTSEFDKNERTVESLTAQNKGLEKSFDVQREAVKAAEDALQRMRDNGIEPSTQAYKRMQANLDNAQAALNETEREIRQNVDAMELAKQGTDEFSDSIDAGGQKTGKYGEGLSKLASLFGINLPSGITDGIDSLGLFDNKMAGTEEGATGGFDSIIGSIGGIDPAAAGAIAAIGGISVAAAKMTADTILEIDRLSAHIQVALGLTEEEAKAAGQIIEAVYVDSMADNRDEAEQALTAVMRLMGATGKEAAAFSNQLVNINRVWGEDFTATARTASILMQQYGITGQEALDVIVAGLQSSANKGQDLLDTFDEYSFIFKTVGNDADMMLSRIIAGTDAGARNADKAADAYKIFFEGALEQNSNFIDGINALGLSSKRIGDDVSAGGKRANDAMTIVAKQLSAVRDESDRNEIAAKLFGEAYKQVGLDVIIAMATVKESVIDTTGSSTKAASDMIDTVSAKWDKFWKIFGNALYQQGKGTIWNAIDTINAYGNIPHYASGTNFHPGGPAVINEYGAEEVWLPRGTKVIPHGQSAGGDTYIMNVSSRDMSSAARVCATQERMRQRSRAAGGK
jgi:phage-related minor tail protein